MLELFSGDILELDGTRFSLCGGLRPMGGQRWNVGLGFEMFLTGSCVGTLGPQLASLGGGAGHRAFGFCSLAGRGGFLGADPQC